MCVRIDQTRLWQCTANFGRDHNEIPNSILVTFSTLTVLVREESGDTHHVDLLLSVIYCHFELCFPECFHCHVNSHYKHI